MPRRTASADREVDATCLWKEDPVFWDTLKTSASLEEARRGLHAHLSEIEAAHWVHGGELHQLERENALDRIAVFHEMLSLENERRAGFSTLETLWRLAQGKVNPQVTAGFVEEVQHLLRAVHGRSGIDASRFADRAASQRGTDSPMEPSQRTAGEARSDFLDQLASQVAQEVSRYPCGMSGELTQRREENRKRIQAFLGATDSDWADGWWQMHHVFRGKAGWEAVRSLVPLSTEESSAIEAAVENGVPWGITPYYLSLFDFRSSSRKEDGQVRSQVIPPLRTVRAMIEHQHDRATAFDFMLERETSPIAGVTRRYASVAILKFCDTCPQICSYCQRNWEISDAMAADRLPTLEAMEPALQWFAAHSEIIDVLVTGGDPLVASDGLLRRLLDRLFGMDHIQHVRIGTRVPVTVPMRITDDLAALLASYRVPGRRQLSIVTHVESAYEITPDLAAAVERLRNHGIGVYNQQVFVAETSRRFQTAANRLALKRVGIDPYYTFFPKGKEELRDYLVPVARILQERREESRLLPGVVRTDESVFNVPGLGKNYLRAGQDREWIALRSDGRRVYLFHPWEKRITSADPWPYVDISIAEYLEHLAELGEDPADYDSIWYYG